MVVGWGEIVDEDGEVAKYWICQNSWGLDFGTEDGFFYMARGDQTGFIESSAVDIRPKIHAKYEDLIVRV